MLKFLRDYLTLGVIIPLPFPAPIANGQAEDANPVMALFTYIANQVNANVPALIPTVSGITPFTPRLAFGGSSVGVTYSVQTGAYFKFQNIVYYSIDLLLTSKGAQVGIATVEGLPFAINVNFPVGSTPMVALVSRNITFAAGYLAGLLSAPTGITIINPVTAAGFNVLTDAAFTNNSEVIVTGFYSA